MNTEEIVNELISIAMDCSGTEPTADYRIEFKEKVIEKLEEAYQHGVQETKEKMEKERISEMDGIFSLKD